MDSRQRALVDKVDAQREQVEARLQLLKARAKEAGADRRVELNEQIQTLEARKASAQQRLQKLREASEDAWQDLAEGVKSAWETLGDSASRALDRFT